MLKTVCNNNKYRKFRVTACCLSEEAFCNWKVHQHRLLSAYRPPSTFFRTHCSDTNHLRCCRDWVSGHGHPIGSMIYQVSLLYFYFATSCMALVRTRRNKDYYQTCVDEVCV